MEVLVTRRKRTKTSHLKEWEEKVQDGFSEKHWETDESDKFTKSEFMVEMIKIHGQFIENPAK